MRFLRGAACREALSALPELMCLPALLLPACCLHTCMQWSCFVAVHAEQAVLEVIWNAAGPDSKLALCRI